MNYPISDIVAHCMPDYLEHYGIKGQQWGNRRFQNPDGSLTEEGKKRYLQNGGRDGNMNLNLRGMLSPNVKNLKYGAYVRKQSPYARKDGETKEEYKARVKKFDEDAVKEFEEDTAREKEELKKEKEVSDFMKSYDKATSSDEKAKVIDEIINKQNEAYRNGDKETFERLNNLWWEVRFDFGKTRFNEYDKLPKGPERDQKLTQLLKDSYSEGQDSDYGPALIDKMQKTHGDFLSGEYKSEESRKMVEDYYSCNKEVDSLRDKFYKEDQKRHIYPKDTGSSFFKEDQLAADHPELKELVDKRDSAWRKYCEKVLKDMDMPVNEETIEYITSVIIWN